MDWLQCLIVQWHSNFCSTGSQSCSDFSLVGSQQNPHPLADRVVLVVSLNSQAGSGQECRFGIPVPNQPDAAFRGHASVLPRRGIGTLPPAAAFGKFQWHHQIQALRRTQMDWLQCLIVQWHSNFCSTGSQSCSDFSLVGSQQTPSISLSSHPTSEANWPIGIHWPIGSSMLYHSTHSA